jgi:hypothetical protein
MDYRASQTTRFDLSSDGTIEGNQPVTIFGIMISNANAEAVEVNFQDSTGSNKGTMTVPCKDTLISDIQFVADKGLTFCSVSDSGDNLGSNVVVTVFHNHCGA